MITELQGRKMTNAQVLDVLKKSCDRHGETLIHARYNSETLQLTVLVNAITVEGGIEDDMDSVLIGLCDLDFKPIEDAVLQLEDESYCPATIVKCNTTSYFALSDAIGGEVLL